MAKLTINCESLNGAKYRTLRFEVGQATNQQIAVFICETLVLSEAERIRVKKIQNFVDFGLEI